MMKVFRGTFIFLLFFTVSNADSNQSMENDFIYIDKLHAAISETVIEWSEIIDTRLSKWLEDNDTNNTDLETNMTDVDENITIVETNTTDSDDNTTDSDDNTADSDDNTTNVDINTPAVKTNRTVVPKHKRAVKPHTPIISNEEMADEINKPMNTVDEKVHAVDQFFQNRKYLNETDNTYIRVRVESYFQSKESDDFDLTLRAQMPFSKSRERFKIFVENLTVDNADDILKDTSKNDDDVTPDIGIHYFGSKHKILSKYSIGLSGIDPFVQARYNMPMHVDEWLIDPVQLFRYSTDDKFEEETNIYFDRKVGEKSLLRILLHRSTQDEIDGMNYVLSAQYFRSTKKDTGFGFAQSFYGNTKYEYTVDNGMDPPQTKQYSGIHDYITSFTWRENIWRKWFYYEVRPSVSFHKQYDYEPNYRVRVFLDFYFGRFN